MAGCPSRWPHGSRILKAAGRARGASDDLRAGLAVGVNLCGSVFCLRSFCLRQRHSSAPGSDALSSTVPRYRAVGQTGRPGTAGRAANLAGAAGPGRVRRCTVSTTGCRTGCSCCRVTGRAITGQWSRASSAGKASCESHPQDPASRGGCPEPGESRFAPRAPWPPGPALGATRRPAGCPGAARYGLPVQRLHPDGDAAPRHQARPADPAPVAGVLGGRLDRRDHRLVPDRLHGDLPPQALGPAAGPGALQPPDRGHVHGPAVHHDRRAVLLHRTGREQDRRPVRSPGRHRQRHRASGGAGSSSTRSIRCAATLPIRT